MPKRAHIYLPALFADWETGFLAATLRTGEGLSSGPWDVIMVSEDGGPVTSLGGLSVVPAMAADALSPDGTDLLVLCGGDTWIEGRHRHVLEVAARRVAEGRPVAAICAATIALARTGALDDKAHTSNDLESLKAQALSYRGAAHYRHQPVVRDRALVTATGVAPVPFTAEILLMVEAVTPEVAEVWAALFTRHDPKDFVRLMELTENAGAAAADLA